MPIFFFTCIYYVSRTCTHTLCNLLHLCNQQTQQGYSSYFFSSIIFVCYTLHAYFNSSKYCSKFIISTYFWKIKFVQFFFLIYFSFILMCDKWSDVVSNMIILRNVLLHDYFLKTFAKTNLEARLAMRGRQKSIWFQSKVIYPSLMAKKNF